MKEVEYVVLAAKSQVTALTRCRSLNTHSPFPATQTIRSKFQNPRPTDIQSLGYRHQLSSNDVPNSNLNMTGMRNVHSQGTITLVVLHHNKCLVLAMPTFLSQPYFLFEVHLGCFPQTQCCIWSEKNFISLSYPDTGHPSIHSRNERGLPFGPQTKQQHFYLNCQSDCSLTDLLKGYLPSVYNADRKEKQQSSIGRWPQRDSFTGKIFSFHYNVLFIIKLLQFSVKKRKVKRVKMNK